MTPIGFVGFLGAAVWILIVSVMLSLRARAATDAPARRPDLDDGLANP